MSSTTTRPPRTPGALVADVVADLQDAAARLAQLAADGAFAEVPGGALCGRCHVDVSRTHAHHVLPWEDGGTTDISNTVLLCVKHHHAVHEGGWTITRTGGVDPHTTGRWTFTPPRTRP